MEKYYKITASGGRACHGGDFTYVLGEWTPRVETRLCQTGYHVCKGEHLIEWLYADNDSLLPFEIYEVECEDLTYYDSEKKGVAASIKPLRLVDTLDEYDLRWLGTEFAMLALPYRADERVVDCIQTVRAYSLGFADASDLSAAWSAARSAAWSAARSAAESAARSAAWSAARSAAWSAAWSAAESAAWSAARSAAESAARSAAWSAAESAAESAAWSAAESAAESACGHIVLEYIGEE